MTTSKRTTRGAGSRPDNGAAPLSAPPESAARARAVPPSASPPGGAAPGRATRSRPRKTPPAPTASAQTTAATAPPADRYASIAQAAYFRSQHRGFKPGHEMEDWLAAEAEVDQRLRAGRVSGDSSD